MQTQSITTPRTQIATVLNVSLPIIAFAVPFLVSGPQWLTGTLVNMLLFLGALTLSRPSLGVVIVIPSIAVLLNGVVFGAFSPYLAYFVPFIWVGNFILVRSTQRLRQSLPWPLLVASGAVLKSAFLFLCAVVFVSVKLVPPVFLQAMSVLQLVTALVGGALAFTVMRSARSGS